MTAFVKRKRKPRGKSLRWDLILDGAVRKYPDGREVCQDNAAGCAEYKERTWKMAWRQNFICCYCPALLTFVGATFEHENLRGMGGAIRDDRIEKDGKPYNKAACLQCNSRRGSKRET